MRVDLKKPVNLTQAFQVMDFLDGCRWAEQTGRENEEPLINYAHSDMREDEKLLTHWLLYITDRQMDFRLVWDVGGFVFSDLVHRYTQEGLGVLRIGEEGAFFAEAEGGGYAFRSRETAPEGNRRLALHGKGAAGSPVRFTSRYYPIDYTSMYFTLYTLEDSFDRSLVEFLARILRKASACAGCGDRERIWALAYGLYKLTYGARQVSAGELKSWERDRGAEVARARTEEIDGWLAKCPEAFWKEVAGFYRGDTRYTAKRVWCSLRDFIKSPEFSCALRAAIGDKIDAEILEGLFADESRQALELPGDVWNNNSTFRGCLFGSVQTLREEKMTLNRFLRERFDSDEAIRRAGCPEQFDVTFDFVPRMCDQQNCDLCLFNSDNRLSSVCTGQAQKLCPVALFSCGYRYICPGRENCRASAFIHGD